MKLDGVKLATADRSLRRALGALSQITQTALWLALLALLIPLIARHWVSWGILPSLVLGDLVQTGAGILYLTLCALALLAFYVLARQRRLVLTLLALLMVLLQSRGMDIGWVRMSAYLAVLLIGIVLIEAYRQNRSLIRQLREDEVNTLRIVWQALYLWSPLLLFILLGFYGNHLLLQGTANLVYETTPVDRYCVITRNDAPIEFPCTGFADDGAMPAVTPIVTEVTLERTLTLRFNQALREGLEAIQSPAFSAPKVARGDLRALSIKLSADAILGMRGRERQFVDEFGGIAEKALGTLSSQRVVESELARYAGVSDLNARRSYFGVVLVRELDRMQSYSQQIIRELFYEDQMQPFLAQVLGVPPRCTAATEHPEVVDQFGKPILMNTATFPCFALSAGASEKIRPLGLADSTRLSIDHWQLERELALIAQIKELAAKNLRSAQQVQDEAGKLVDAVPDNIDLGRKYCHLLTNPGNCLTNFAKGEAEDAYADQQDVFERGATSLVADKSESLARSAEEQLLGIRTKLYAALDASTGYLRSAVIGLEQAGRLLSVLLTVFLCLAIIKSLLYVLATRIFDAKNGFHMDLGAEDAVQGRYQTAPTIRIPRSFEHALITKDILDNQEVSTAIAPWPFSAPIARIVKGAYFAFNRGKHFELSEEEMSFTRASGHDIVDWHLQPGEEVVFHYRNFFGASANVKLKTTISLRLSTILLGRFVFHSALCEEGEGRLLLTAAGTVRDQARTDSTSLERLIAWNKHARFRVASQGTIRSVLLDGYAIVRVREEGRHNGLIVVEAIRESRSKVLGSLRFVRNLLLPF